MTFSIFSFFFGHSAVLSSDTNCPKTLRLLYPGPRFKKPTPEIYLAHIEQGEEDIRQIDCFKYGACIPVSLSHVTGRALREVADSIAQQVALDRRTRPTLGDALDFMRNESAFFSSEERFRTPDSVVKTLEEALREYDGIYAYLIFMNGHMTSAYAGVFTWMSPQLRPRAFIDNPTWAKETEEGRFRFVQLMINGEGVDQISVVRFLVDAPKRRPNR